MKFTFAIAMLAAATQAEELFENQSEALNEDSNNLENVINMVGLAPRITREQAKCYLHNQTDLRRAFGGGKLAWVKAMTHWRLHGFNEGREMCYVGNIHSKCADEGSMCKCKGRVYYGRGNMHFKKMLQFNTVTRHSTSQVSCTNKALTDIAPNVRKQCICEEELTEPYVQGSEAHPNWKHHCEGDVYYVRTQGTKRNNLLLAEAFSYGFGRLMKNQIPADGYKCNNSVFGDPAPGYPKHCFCDADRQISRYMVSKWQKKFRGKTLVTAEEVEAGLV